VLVYTSRFRGKNCSMPTYSCLTYHRFLFHRNHTVFTVRYDVNLCTLYSVVSFYLQLYLSQSFCQNFGYVFTENTLTRNLLFFHKIGKFIKEFPELLKNI
jgi:hypothetical protein